MQKKDGLSALMMETRRRREGIAAYLQYTVVELHPSTEKEDTPGHHPIQNYETSCMVGDSRGLLIPWALTAHGKSNTDILSAHLTSPSIGPHKYNKGMPLGCKTVYIKGAPKIPTAVGEVERAAQICTNCSERKQGRSPSHIMGF